MVPPQSPAQQLPSGQDTTATDTTAVDQAVDQFSNAFSEAFRLLLAGNWEGLYDHLTDGALYLSGLFAERGQIGRAHV